MNTLIKSMGFASTFVSLSATAAVVVSDTNTTTFNFGGTIEAMCKVKGTGNSSATDLVLNQSNASQDIGTLEVWCNTGRNATTNYSSANNGFLVDGSNKIAYTLSVGESTNAIDLSSAYTDAATQAATGADGTAQSHALKITPQSSGLDNAGLYSDTITVTVTYN